MFASCATELTVMSTRSEDQDLVFKTATEKGAGRILPCFGWHPWFSHQLAIDIDIDSEGSSLSAKESFDTLSHYTKVLTPSCSADHEFLSSLPRPLPLSQYLSDTKTRLLSCPNSPVGEVGLDRAFRLPNPWSGAELQNRNVHITPGSREGRSLSLYKVHMSHQRAVLKAQLRLAGELSRPASVHSVQAHGVVLEVLRELWKGHERRVPSRKERKRGDQEASPPPPTTDDGSCPFPPRICMHSYSGPVEQLRLFLDPTVPSDVYFSFSSVINLHGPSLPKVLDVIKALPENRLLIESDLHTAGPEMDNLLEEVARTVCAVRGWSLEGGIQQLAQNWKAFVFG